MDPENARDSGRTESISRQRQGRARRDLSPTASDILLRLSLSRPLDAGLPGEFTLIRPLPSRHAPQRGQHRLRGSGGASIEQRSTEPSQHHQTAASLDQRIRDFKQFAR